jgi:hypothetical protein
MPKFSKLLLMLLALVMLSSSCEVSDSKVEVDDVFVVEAIQLDSNNTAVLGNARISSKLIIPANDFQVGDSLVFTKKEFSTYTD